MRVALTGASGFLGSVIARRLHQDGHAITALVRPTSRRDHIEASVDRFVEGEQDDENAWPALLDGADCVIHNAFDWEALRGDLNHHLASNLLASIRLLHASAPRQFIYMSSVAVHHDMHPRVFDEAGHGLIDELHVLRPSSLYGACKAAAEDHLWEQVFAHGRNCCTIRPCAVYGMDPKPERSIGWPIVERLIRERAYSRPAGGKFVHVDDVAEVVARLVGRDPEERVYNLADCYARWCDWADWIAEILGIDAEIDRSSPPEPRNIFTKDAARSLGVPLNRGHEGIRAYLREMVPKAAAQVR